MLTAFCRGMHMRPPDHPGPLGGSWRPRSFQRDGDAGISRRCQGGKWRAAVPGTGTGWLAPSRLPTGWAGPGCPLPTPQLRSQEHPQSPPCWGVGCGCISTMPLGPGRETSEQARPGQARRGLSRAGVPGLHPKREAGPCHELTASISVRSRLPSFKKVLQPPLLPLCLSLMGWVEMCHLEARVQLWV